MLALLSWLADLAAAIVTDAEDAAMLADRLDAARALAGAALAAEVIDIARIIGESVASEAAFKRLAVLPDFDEDAAARAAILMVAIAQAVAIGRVDWTSRPAARAARAAFVDLAHRAYAIAATLGPDLYAWLAGLVSVAVRLVSDRAANATPVVLVDSGLSLPSTVLAYQLYGDAKRAAGLVDIARSATPMIMPGRFEALAS
jgi:hypothetical protein